MWDIGTQGVLSISINSESRGLKHAIIFKLTQPIDHISTQKTGGTKHCCSYSTGGGASSFPSGDNSMVQLPLLDCGNSSG